VEECAEAFYVDEDSGEKVVCVISFPGEQGDDDDDDLTGGEISIEDPDCADECPACCHDGSGGGLHQNCDAEDGVLKDYARKTCRATCGVCILPTSYPTSFPTSRPRSPTTAPTARPTIEGHHLLPKCHVKDKHFEHGWQGGGLDENYCNLCRCHMGMMICTRKTCGIPTNLPPGAAKCLHLTCSYHTAPDPRDHQLDVSRVLVHHKREETHKQHRCAYNKWDQKCTCYCWEPIVAHFETYATPGSHRFGGLVGFLSHRCENVVFPAAYDPSKGDMNVVVTVAHSNDVWTHQAIGHHEHDPAVAWVESSSHLGFTVCARADEEYWHKVWNNTKSRHEHFVDVDYYAWQGVQAGTEEDISAYRPFGGAQSGSTEMILPGLQAGESKCDTVPFGNKFRTLRLNDGDPSPLVFGSIDRKYQKQDISTVDRVAVTHWLDEVTDDHFKVCFRAFSEEHEVPLNIKGGVPPEAIKCLKMTCTARETTPDRALITVSSSALEPHRQHKCAYDESDQACQCMCWDPISEDELPAPQPLFFSWMAFQPTIYGRYDAPYRASGRYTAKAEWATYESIVHQDAHVMCDMVTIAATVPERPIVLASASTKDISNHVQHGLMTWIDNIHLNQFKVCTVLSAAQFVGSIEDVEVIWDWVAFQPRHDIRESLAP